METVTLTAELWFDHEPQLDPDAVPGAVPAPTTDQTWDWEEADAVLARCTHSLLVAEKPGGGRSYSERLDAFVPTLNAAIERLSPDAIWLPHSERVARPTTFDALAACVNVRMFLVNDTDQRLMETLGLHALGLPDVQCVFDADEPASIAGLLFDVAGYLLQSGDVIEDGDTIGNRPWRCDEGTSVVAPERRMFTLS